MKYPPTNYFLYQYNNKLIEPLIKKNKLFIKELYMLIWTFDLIALLLLAYIPRQNNIAYYDKKNN